MVSSGVPDALIPPGSYVIVRLMPPVGGEPHYRAKSAVDGRERALLEGQIRPVMPGPAPEVAGVGAAAGQATARGRTRRLLVEQQHNRGS